MIDQRKCGICQELKPLTRDNFHADKTRSKGFGYNCKICEKQRSAEKHLKNPRKDRYSKMTKEQKIAKSKWCYNYSKTPKGKAIALLSSYLTFDKKKGFETDLTQDDFINVFKAKCVYCGYLATGFDRKDNSIGHTKLNCVPCCKECNVLRMDNFSHEEMFIIGQSIKKIKAMRGPLNPPHFELK